MSFEKLKEHFGEGHSICIVRYGSEDQYAVECEICNSVILSFNKPWEEAPGSGLFRTVIEIEVLTGEPLKEWEWSDLAYHVTEGHASGYVLSEESSEVPVSVMRQLLIDQHSDPEFFAPYECMGCGTESYEQYCAECAPKTKCPHGAILGDCNACDIAGDLAYDADREGR